MRQYVVFEMRQGLTDLSMRHHLSHMLATAEVLEELLAEVRSMLHAEPGKPLPDGSTSTAD